MVKLQQILALIWIASGFLVLPCSAATVTAFSIKCKDKQEGISDNIYVVIEKDGVKLNFDPTSSSTPRGAHKFKHQRMTENTVWEFEQNLLDLMSFNKTLKVTVFEFDGVNDDNFGDTGNIGNAGGSKSVTRKSPPGVADFEYEIKWTIQP